MDTVKSRAHRILSHLVRYVDLTAEKTAVEIPRRMALASGEELLGAYRNTSAVDTWLFFTTRGVRSLEGGGWALFEYRDMSLVPMESKDQRWIGIALKDGRAARLPVEGGEGRIRDALEVRRFLMRVSSDLRRQAEQPAG